MEQHFGKFQGIHEAGCQMYNCITTSMTPVSLATQQLICSSDCKTKDNVTLTVRTAIQYKVEKESVKVALFDVANPREQIQACVDDVLRSTLPTLDLDEAYSAKEHMVQSILTSVKASMQPFGFHISNVLVTDLQPERSVLDAMNQINAQRRLREAAVEKAEADKIVLIKKAEADAESKYLSGVGLARMRTAIADGYKDTINSMTTDNEALSPHDIVHMMLTTQYLDTLNGFATDTHNSILVPHGPGVVKDIESQVRDGFMVGGQLTGQQMKR